MQSALTQPSVRLGMSKDKDTVHFESTLSVWFPLFDMIFSWWRALTKVHLHLLTFGASYIIWLAVTKCISCKTSEAPESYISTSLFNTMLLYFFFLAHTKGKCKRKKKKSSKFTRAHNFFFFFFKQMNVCWSLLLDLDQWKKLTSVFMEHVRLTKPRSESSTSSPY